MARDLHAIGIDQLVGYGDTAVIETLAQQGQPMSRYDTAVPAQIAAAVLSGEMLVVDVRSQSEWNEGHIPGAHHLMLGHLPQRAHELITTQPILINCQKGNRSAIAASILAAKGTSTVMNLQGGIHHWAQAGLPIVYGP